jgi:LacI family transcriptional regulator
VNRRVGTATIRDVAKMAGVVPSTVSHVINNTAPVSVQTRQRVFDAIQKLGYRRNVLASSLRQQQTMSIGLVVPNVAEPLCAEVMRGVSEEASATGYEIILGHTGHDRELEEKQLARMLDRRVDGLVVVSDGDAQMASYRSIDVPLVLVNRQTSPQRDDPPSVDVDNRRAGWIAARHLIQLGHTEIGMITSTPSCERHIGYRQALADAGIAYREERVVCIAEPADDLLAQGRVAMRRMLSQTRVTACFIVDDMLAVGALEAADDAHLRVPRDLAIVSCGDLGVAAMARPRLTTVGHPKHRLGAQSVRLLIDLLRNRTTESRVTMPVELIVRDTCGALMRTA